MLGRVNAFRLGLALDISTPPPRGDVDWRKLWKLKGLERIKMFIFGELLSILCYKRKLYVSLGG